MQCVPRAGRGRSIPTRRRRHAGEVHAPGLDESAAEKVRITLQERLTALSDLALTLKHIHWNVVGRTSSPWTRRSIRSSPR